MFGFPARHVVESSTGTRVLFGAFEHSVAVYDLVRGTRSRTTHTTFDFGGYRLALSDELDGIVAGAYTAFGLALYQVSTGDEVWRRRDIKKIQHISLSRDGLSAYCGVAESSLVAVDLRTGETITKVRGAAGVHDSRYDTVQFVDVTRPRVLGRAGELRFLVDRTTWAFLDVAFAPGIMLLAEAGGPVRSIDLATGHEKWRYKPPQGSHVLRLGYRGKAPCVLGVECSYIDGGASHLIELSLDDGHLQYAADIGEARDSCFALAGSVLVTAEGQIIDTTTGAQQEAR